MKLHHHPLLPLPLLPLLTTASSTSKIFSPQPAACATCLDPILNTCEASFGPLGAGDRPAFAACICSRASLSSVVRSCISPARPCADGAGAVSESVMAWCFAHDGAFRETVCELMAGVGSAAYAFIPEPVRTTECRGKADVQPDGKERAVSTPDGWESATALVTAPLPAATVQSTVVVLVTDAAAQPTVSEIVTGGQTTEDSIPSENGFGTDSGGVKAAASLALLSFVLPAVVFGSLY